MGFVSAPGKDLIIWTVDGDGYARIRNIDNGKIITLTTNTGSSTSLSSEGVRMLSGGAIVAKNKSGNLTGLWNTEGKLVTWSFPVSILPCGNIFALSDPDYLVKTNCIYALYDSSAKPITGIGLSGIVEITRTIGDYIITAMRGENTVKVWGGIDGSFIKEFSDFNNTNDNLAKAYAWAASSQATKRSQVSLATSKIKDYFEKMPNGWKARTVVEFNFNDNTAGFRHTSKGTKSGTSRKTRDDSPFIAHTYSYDVGPDADMAELIKDIEEKMFLDRIYLKTDWARNHAVRLREYALGNEKAQEFVANALVELVGELADHTKQGKAMGLHSGTAILTEEGTRPMFEYKDWFYIASGAISANRGRTDWMFNFEAGTTREQIAERLCEAANVPYETYALALVRRAARIESWTAVTTGL